MVGAAGQTVPADRIPPPAQPTSAQPTASIVDEEPSYRPITGKERLRWVVKSSVGPQTLASGVFLAGLATARDTPHEYGPHWDGFGKRYGIRLTGTATSSALEASLGALWKEDPRYFRATGEPLKGRIKNVVVMTFASRRADGSMAPAYARYLGKTGGNFISNSWRADSASSVSDACLRTVFGFVGRMSGNAFAEFWPDVKKHVFHRSR